MDRFKDFNATGIAPDGRLYAGDLNLMQDLVAALSDFAQTIDANVLRVGDSTLTLSKFGTDELWFSKMLRVTGILRGLGGLVAGTYTTTARNAIPAGSRPYGLIILNTTTNRYEINIGSDATPQWVGIGYGLADADVATGAAISGKKLDLVGSVVGRGLDSAKPSAAANPGMLYFSTDVNGGTLYRSDGSIWRADTPAQQHHTAHESGGTDQLSLAGRQVQTNRGTSPPASPAIGDIWIYPFTGGYWMFVYDSNETTYKWKFVGGSSMFSEILSDDTTNSTSYVDPGVNGPSITVPRAGDYEIEFGARVYSGNPSVGTSVYISLAIGATAPSDNDAISPEFTTANEQKNQSRKLVKTGLSASDVVKMQFKVAGAGNAAHIQNRWLSVKPRRVI